MYYIYYVQYKCYIRTCTYIIQEARSPAALQRRGGVRPREVLFKRKHRFYSKNKALSIQYLFMTSSFI